MLPVQNRLKKKSDFERVLRGGRPFFTPILAIKVTKNNLAATRFGIVISKKVSKKAVERNKLRRRLREVLRLNLELVKPGFDVVILTKAVGLTKKYQELEKTLLFALEKSYLLKR